MAILGIYEGHNAGAALISERTAHVIAVVEEERFSRIKNHDSRPGADGPPVQSVAWCLQKASEADEPVQAIAVGLMPPALLQTRAWTSFNHVVTQGEPQRWQRAEQLGLNTHDFETMPERTQTERVANALQTIKDAGLDPSSVPQTFVEHHLCHAAAFLLSPADRALVITLDGKGDDLSGGAWQAHGTELRQLQLIPAEHSLGHFYSAATVACGFRPQRDEGKFMALAAHGALNTELYGAMRQLVSFDPARGIRSRLSEGIIQGPYPDRVATHHNARMAEMVQGVAREDAAHTIQRVLEEVVCSFVDHLLGETGERTVVVAGGVFANVALNRRLGSLPGLDELHVHPGMTDSGIALGAAAWAYQDRTQRRPRPLENLGLGPSYPQAEATAPFLDAGYVASTDSIPAEIQLARALARGRVVARFVDGCEYGPRALGFRSVLAPATCPRILAELNVRLGRSQLMPFAPMVLATWVPLLFHGFESLQAPMKFMTTAVTCTDFARQHLPAAVHHDGTARPQVVHPDTDHALALLLTSYHDMTGTKGLVNTSFNLHDEPIVCTPAAAARSAAAAQIDVVQVGAQTLALGPRAMKWVET